MNATERAALLQRFELHDALTDAVGERTLEIVARRRQTATVRRRGWLVRRMLVAADLLGLALAIFVAEWIVNRRSTAGALDARDEIIAFFVTLPAWVVIAKIYGLYDRDEERTDHSTADDFAGVFHMVTVCTWVFTVGTYITGLAHPTAPKLVVFWSTAVLLVCTGRAAARTFARRSVMYLQNAVIVGAGDVGQVIARKLLQHPEYGVNVVGFIDDQPKERHPDLGHLALLGSPDRLASVVQLFDVDRVIVAFSNQSHEETLELLRSVKAMDVQVDIVPRFFEAVGPSVQIHTIEGIPIVGLPPSDLARSSRLIKRTVDLAISTCMLIILFPIFLVVGIAIKCGSAGPILYRHQRVGLHGKPIDVLKFRTMHRRFCRGEDYGGEEADQAFERLMSDPVTALEFETTYKLERDPRVTQIGRLLRASSIDELPQLLNVIRGELSLVGPRPITRDELERYGRDAEALVKIKPGVTGYWQVNGRSRLSYEDRVRLDMAYIGGWSLGLDMAILARTVSAIWNRNGAV